MLWFASFQYEAASLGFNIVNNYGFNYIKFYLELYLT